MQTQTAAPAAPQMPPLAAPSTRANEISVEAKKSIQQYVNAAIHRVFA